MVPFCPSRIRFFPAWIRPASLLTPWVVSFMLPMLIMPRSLPLLVLVSSPPCVSNVRSLADCSNPPLLSVLFTVNVRGPVLLTSFPRWLWRSLPVIVVVPVPVIVPSWLSISPVVKVSVPSLITPPVSPLLAVVSFSPCVSSIISPVDSIFPPVLLSSPLSSFRFFLLDMAPLWLLRAC